MKNFPDRLESLRDGLTQKQMSSKIGIPLNTYTNWIRGINVPKSDQLEKICTVFGVSADWLLGLSTAPPSPAAPGSKSEFKTLHCSPGECQECKKKDVKIERLERVIDKLTK